MEDFLESMNIFKKYMDKEVYTPFQCEHDVLIFTVTNDCDHFEEADIKRLSELGWEWDEEFDCFSSFRFGSS